MNMISFLWKKPPNIEIGISPSLVRSCSSFILFIQLKTKLMGRRPHILKIGSIIEISRKIRRRS